MIKASDAKTLYNNSWAIENPSLEELSKYIENGSKYGCYEFVAFFDSIEARDEATAALVEAGWYVGRYNGGDGIEISASV